jgi:protein tyrosine/serine phosphatase
MPFENLNNNHYLAAEKTAVNTSLKALETSLIPRIKNLNAEERQKYGSINETNKLIVNKVKDYRSNQPTLSSPDVDWVEFQNDFDSRDFLQATILRLQNLIDGLNNNKILHDFDNYQAALTDYDYSKYKAATKVAGFENKVNEMGQFFNRTGTVVPTAKTADTTTAS